jgi:hypothetical protein
MGLAVLEVTARDVRVEQVQQGHSLVNEVVRQTPLSREDIDWYSLGVKRSGL